MADKKSVKEGHEVIKDIQEAFGIEIYHVHTQLKIGHFDPTSREINRLEKLLNRDDITHETLVVKLMFPNG